MRRSGEVSGCPKLGAPPSPSADRSSLPPVIHGRGGRSFRSGRPAGPAKVSSVGFTLLEVIVVLSIVVMVASLAWPPLMRYVRERTIREQAHVVRIELAAARRRAIDAGLVYQFRYEPDGRRFLVLPHDRPDIGSGSNSSQEAAAAQAAADGIEVVSGELAASCRFGVLKAQNPLTHAEQAVFTERLPEEWLALVPDSQGLRETSWAPAICFYSDGTADNATVTILDAEDRQIEITVRGLTGTIEAGPIRQERRL